MALPLLAPALPLLALPLLPVFDYDTLYDYDTMYDYDTLYDYATHPPTEGGVQLCNTPPERWGKYFFAFFFTPTCRGY